MGGERGPLSVRGLALLAATLLVAGCYTLGAPAPDHPRLFVEVVDDDGIDVDLAALVARSARAAVAARPELTLTSRSDADAVLRLALIPGATGLSPLADPSRRSPEYRVEVRVEAVLMRDEGEALWSSGALVGEATYTSHPGSIIALDGARRLALSRAADDAAQRVITALLYTR